MSKHFKIIAIIVFSGLIFSCTEDDDKDDIKPVIDLLSFPLNCDTLYFNETVVLRFKLTDNKELGSFNINIHHNFDHHSHSTEVTECNLSPKKEPVNPFVFIQDFVIPEGQTEYQFEEAITIGEGDENGKFDTGDYHLFLRLTDKTGWPIQKGLSIKLLNR